MRWNVLLVFEVIDGEFGGLRERLAQVATGSRPCLERRKVYFEVRSTFFEMRFASVEARARLLGGIKLGFSVMSLRRM